MSIEFVILCVAEKIHMSQSDQGCLQKEIKTYDAV